MMSNISLEAARIRAEGKIFLRTFINCGFMCNLSTDEGLVIISKSRAPVVTLLSGASTNWIRMGYADGMTVETSVLD